MITSIGVRPSPIRVKLTHRLLAARVDFLRLRMERRSVKLEQMAAAYDEAFWMLKGYERNFVGRLNS